MADRRQAWPKAAHTGGNAGVMLVGISRLHGNLPAVLLGGRWYTGKKIYAYTDFGGGVDRDKGETPQQGAFREFSEELLGLGAEAAQRMAGRLAETTTPALVGDRPFVHKGYVMFIVHADEILDAAELPADTEGTSAIDQFYTHAKHNSELTSVALISIEELLRGAACDGRVCPLAVRQLDDQKRETEKIVLRQLMVGAGGPIATITDTLEAFASQAFRKKKDIQSGSIGRPACYTTKLPEAPILGRLSTAHGGPNVPAQRRKRWTQMLLEDVDNLTCVCDHAFLKFSNGANGSISSDAAVEACVDTLERFELLSSISPENVNLFVSKHCRKSNGQMDRSCFQTFFTALLAQILQQLADETGDAADDNQRGKGETVDDDVAKFNQTLSDWKLEAQSNRSSETEPTMNAPKRRWKRSQVANAGPVNATLPVAAQIVDAGDAHETLPNAVPPLGKRPYVFDMETGDPDDVLTLLFLGSHPRIELRAVTITPGTDEQVALVRWLLQEMGLTGVRMGAQAWPSNAKKNVNLNTLFYKSFGRTPVGKPFCERADTVLLECCDESVTLVTGAPLNNLGDVLKRDGFRLGRWVAQGGFAGEGVVPRERQMDKFKGMTTCATWNFGGNIPAAEAAITSLAIEKKVCVSKNVCHAVVYDDEFHAALRSARHRHPKIFGMIYDAMDVYLRHKPEGKKLHDPLALAVALDESVCELAEVRLFCQKGKWGSEFCPGSNIWISVGYDAEKFQRTLLE